MQRNLWLQPMATQFINPSGQIVNQFHDSLN